MIRGPTDQDGRKDPDYQCSTDQIGQSCGIQGTQWILSEGALTCSFPYLRTRPAIYLASQRHVVPIVLQLQ